MFLLLASLFACHLLFIACTDSTPDRGDLLINFDHVVDGQDLAYDEIRYTNAAGNNYAITRLEYIISDVSLETTSGKRVDLADTHYRNALVNSTRSLATQIPGGTYHMLHFTFGIDGDKNQTGALPSNDFFNNMAWPSPMGGGYHYMRMEGLFRTTDGESSFLTHTGPSGGSNFSFDISLPVDLSIDKGTWDIDVVMDINQWYEEPTVYNFNDHGGIMGNADAQFTLQENGATSFSIGHIGRKELDEEDHANK